MFTSWNYIPFSRNTTYSKTGVSSVNIKRKQYSFDTLSLGGYRWFGFTIIALGIIHIIQNLTINVVDRLINASFFPFNDDLRPFTQIRKKFVASAVCPTLRRQPNSFSKSLRRRHYYFLSPLVGTTKINVKI